MQDVALAETDAKLTTRYVRVVFRLVVEMSFVVKLQNNNVTTSNWYKPIFSVLNSMLTILSGSAPLAVS